MSDFDSEGLDVRDVGDLTVIGFGARRILDEPTSRRLEQEIRDLVERQGRRQIVLNFRRLEHLSPEAIAKLILLNKAVEISGGRLALCNVAPPINEVLAVVRVNKVLHFVPDPLAGGADPNDGGVAAGLKPPKPSGGGKVSLEPPSAENDE